MAKTIKFNLICDGNSVRTLEDLQENFSIEDILKYYDNNLLQRWLYVRGYTEELSKVESITSNKPIEILHELIKIFDIPVDEQKADESLYILRYQDEKEQNIEQEKKHEFSQQSVIKDYKREYNDLVHIITENTENLSLIKASISLLTADYKWILDMDYRRIFTKLMRQKQYLSVMCLLMNEDCRNYFIITPGDREKMGADEYRDKTVMYNQLTTLLSSPGGINELRGALGENLKVFAGKTDEYWRDIEPRDKKCMIIKMDSGDFVRSSGLIGGDLSDSDVENQFVILAGIDYKSNYSNHKLMYMEV